MLPYDYRDRYQIVGHITDGERPSRPMNPSQSRWLPDSVWEVIEVGWRHKSDQRCELSVLHHVFSTVGRREVQDGELGDLSTENDEEVGKPQQRGRIIPRITSFFQFRRDSEPEIERHIDEMDKAGLSASHLVSRPEADMKYSVCRI